jgi:PTS system glucitol/sorbitol-specific IIB component
VGQEEKTYKKVRIVHGPNGWGGPLEIEPKPGRELIYSVTGGGIHPLAQYIADLTGGTPFDGFRSRANWDEIAVAVIDCGGTARVAVYPMKKVPTVDVIGTTPAGPAFRMITPDLFVSGVREEDVTVIE